MTNECRYHVMRDQAWNRRTLRCWHVDQFWVEEFIQLNNPDSRWIGANVWQVLDDSPWADDAISDPEYYATIERMQAFIGVYEQERSQ